MQNVTLVQDSDQRRGCALGVDRHVVLSRLGDALMTHQLFQNHSRYPSGSSVTKCPPLDVSRRVERRVTFLIDLHIGKLSHISNKL